MKRTKHTYHPEDKVLLERGDALYKKKVSAILTSDWHLREDTPACFTGDFQKEQWDAVDFVKKLQEKYGCPVIHAGDLFHHWKPSPWLLSYTITFLPKQFFTIYGQHDLPQHNWELREKSGIHVLSLAGALTIFAFGHYGQEFTGDGTLGASGNIISVWHHLTYITKPYPEATGGMAEGILRKYSNLDLLVTGDNHTSFTVEYKGRRLVNPGNLTRQTADQIEYKPRVALWYAEDNSIAWVYIPIKEGVITREYIDKSKNRDERIDAFISSLNTDWKGSVSFEDNLELFFQKNKTKESIKQIIYKSLENDNIRKGTPRSERGS